LVNIMKNGILHPSIYVDDMLFTNIGLRSGSKHFYALLSAGTRSSSNSFRDTFDRSDNNYFITRAGFGFEYAIKNFFVDIDISTGNINVIDRDWSTYEDIDNTQIYQLRLTAGYKIFRHLGIFGGISYDFFHKWKDNSPDPRDFGGTLIGDASDRNIHKVGFFGGIQF